VRDIARHQARGAARGVRARGGTPSGLLILRTGALGDAVLTLPLVAAARAAGLRRVVILGAPASWRFLAPAASGVEAVDIESRAWLGLFGTDARLGEGASQALSGIDAALVFLGDPRETATAALRQAGVGRVIRASAPRRDEALPEPPAEPADKPVEIAWPPLHRHAAARLLAPAAALGLCDERALWPAAPPSLADDDLLRLTPGETAAVLRALSLATAPSSGLLALHPGSGGIHKCWPADRFAALAQAAQRDWGVAPVFLIGPADAPCWEALRRALPPGLAPLVLRDRPLREVLALLALARAYVGNDSGVTHLAARACPTLALFGPTDPRVWHPLGRRVAVLRAASGDLAALPVEAVLDALAALLRA